MDCVSNSRGNNSCTHDRDAGVKCLLGKYLQTVSTSSPFLVM